MDEKEIIDVEVVEEAVEVLEGEADQEEKPTYTDEEIDEKVVFLKDCLKDNNYEVNDMILRVAKEIAANSKDYLDNDTYLWVMYAYAHKYAQEDNKNSERFCYIRMKNILDAEVGNARKPQALTFVKNTLTASIKEEVEHNTAFMNDVINGIKKQFFMMELVMLVVFAIIIKLILRYDLIMTLVFTAIVGVFNYLFTFRNLKKKYLVNQTNTSKSYCNDDEILAFDRPVSLS
ncbi:MAG: hypothetical protein PHQ89_04050 [Bacilli bacterium]|nr:hypothetical protein [Bacilli bacterium]